MRCVGVVHLFGDFVLFSLLSLAAYVLSSELFRIIEMTKLPKSGRVCISVFLSHQMPCRSIHYVCVHITGASLHQSTQNRAGCMSTLRYDHELDFRIKRSGTCGYIGARVHIQRATQRTLVHLCLCTLSTIRLQNQTKCDHEYVELYFLTCACVYHVQQRTEFGKSNCRKEMGDTHKEKEKRIETDTIATQGHPPVGLCSVQVVYGVDLCLSSISPFSDLW